jgi:hypothetical protein
MGAWFLCPIFCVSFTNDGGTAELPSTQVLLQYFIFTLMRIFDVKTVDPSITHINYMYVDNHLGKKFLLHS